MVYRVLTIGAYDVSDSAIRVDKKAAKVLAAIGIPVACFLHGYAGFIFGSVKANALWMSPLMPVIFIMSAVVSGIALCMLTYIVIMEWQAFRQRRGGGLEVAGEIKGAEKEVINKAARYLLGFLVAAISLEMSHGTFCALSCMARIFSISLYCSTHWATWYRSYFSYCQDVPCGERSLLSYLFCSACS
jgi:Ni/Fe-hydrogenase subunit HybB-like protein